MSNLIGISGKIGSGKDTVGSILQWIVTSKTGFRNGTYSNKECEEWLNGKYPGDTSIQEISGYQIKKYADKLKDMVCLLIGCSREQLEDREFKEKELSEEWWYYQYGKSLYCYKTEKILLTRLMNSEFLEPCTEEDLNNCLIKLTPRKLLQLLGTEAGRDIIHPNIWVNALFADYHCIHCGETPCSEGHKNVKGGERREPKWIITDVRFPNEAKAIKDRGGIVIRVNRAMDSMALQKGNVLLSEVINNMCVEQHPSETALDDYEFDHVIYNNGSIEELVEKVKNIFNGEEEKEEVG